MFVWRSILFPAVTINMYRSIDSLSDIFQEMSLIQFSEAVCYLCLGKIGRIEALRHQRSPGAERDNMI
jgi:hypothetical protein